MPINASVKVVCALPDPVVSNQKLTATCGVHNHGDTMYVLKSKGSKSDNKKYPLCFIKVLKFNSAPKPKVVYIKKNGKDLGNYAIHANSITYARPDGTSDNWLFISTSNGKTAPNVLMIDTMGAVKRECYVYNTNGERTSLNSLTYYGMYNGQMHFIGVNGTSENRVRYRFYKFDGFNFQALSYQFFGDVTQDNGYSKNDITYANGILYHVMFKSSTKVIKNNRVYCYNIQNMNIDQFHGQSIASTLIQCNAPKDYDKKFELEGVVERERKLYTAGNVESSNQSKNHDNVFLMNT